MSSEEDIGRFVARNGYNRLFARADVQAFIRDHSADLCTDTEDFPEAYAVIARS